MEDLQCPVIKATMAWHLVALGWCQPALMGLGHIAACDVWGLYQMVPQALKPSVYYDSRCLH